MPYFDVNEGDAMKGATSGADGIRIVEAADLVR